MSLGTMVTLSASATLITTFCVFGYRFSRIPWISNEFFLVYCSRVSRGHSSRSVSCLWSLSVFLVTFNWLVVASSFFCRDASAEAAVASECLASLSSLSLNSSEAFKSETSFLSASFSLVILAIEVWISISYPFISSREDSRSSCPSTSCAITPSAAVTSSSSDAILSLLATFGSSPLNHVFPFYVS